MRKRIVTGIAATLAVLIAADLLVSGIALAAGVSGDFMQVGVTPDLKIQAKVCPYSDTRKCWLFSDANFVFQALLSIRNHVLSTESTVATHTTQISQLQSQVAILQSKIGSTQGAPTFVSMTPTSGPVGTMVIITGTKFTGTTSVKLNGTTAGYSVNTDTTIYTSVPPGATTGVWAITTGSGSVNSGTFTVSASQTPTIASFTPNNGVRGDAITITGTNFTGATVVRFNGTSATYVVRSGTEITAIVPSGATTGTVSVSTATGTATTSASFVVGAPDNILPSNMIALPTSGWTATDPDNGDPVIMTVTNEGGSKVGLTEVTDTYGHFVQAWNTQWTASPVLNTLYKFSARIAAGSRTSVSIQIQSYGVAWPSITVNLTTCVATNFGATSYTVAAVQGQANTCDIALTAQFVTTSMSHNGGSWDITIQTSEPGNVAASGVAVHVENVRLQQGNGTPVITSFTPSSGPASTSVTLSGHNFTGATAVRFNGVSAPYTVISDATINTSVPASATTGTISVVSPAGTGSSATSFTVN